MLSGEDFGRFERDAFYSSMRDLGTAPARVGKEGA
jgi:hypothetical protein